jgi:C1A family cysteine protease
MKKEIMNRLKGKKMDRAILIIVFVFSLLGDAMAHSSATVLPGVGYNVSQHDFIPGVGKKPGKQNALLNSNPPSSYSLEQYLPPIGNQGDIGSCVGWASAYYGLTIVKRIENGPTAPAFSPWSVFNRYGHIYNKPPCSPGAEIDHCLEILKSKGCPAEKDYKIPYCAIDKNKTKYKDRLYSFSRVQTRSVIQIKSSIAANSPVVMVIKIFGGGLGNSMNSKFLDSNGIIKMDFFKDKKYADGLHAMCIVGYDDAVGGGAFKIVNSWGKDWGKDGFCWLRYSDLNVLVSAHSMQPKPEGKTKKPARSAK